MSGLIPPAGKAFPPRGHVPANTGLSIWGNPFERRRRDLVIEHNASGHEVRVLGVASFINAETKG